MHGTTIKHKARILPAIGIAGLVLITGAMIAPVSTNDTYALMPSLSGDNSNNDHAVPVEDTTYAEATVQLTMDTANSYTSTITPNSMTDKTGRINLGASIKVTNSGGYTIKLSTPSNTLTSTEGHTIDSTTTVTTLDQMEAGKYGYYATTTTDSYYHPIELEKTVYSVEASSKSPITETKHVNIGFGTKVGGDQPAGNYTNTFTLSVVSKPGIVATFGGITTMQELTPTICSKADENDTAYLKDTRDNNYYWVTKLADGNCWMSQNLDLNLDPANPLTVANGSASDYTPEAKTIVSAADPDAYASAYWNNNNAIQSWDEGKYVVIKPEGAYEGSLNMTMGDGGIGGFAKSDILNTNNIPVGGTSSRVENFGIVVDVSSDDWAVATDPNFTASSTYEQTAGEIKRCTDFGLCAGASCTETTPCTETKTAGWAIDPVNKIYDAHYLVGNYYQWFAATAQTAAEGVKITGNGDIVSTSICPKGWQLPLSGAMNDVKSGSFYNLLSYYNLTSVTKPDGNKATDNIAEPPLFFNRAGAINASTNSLGLVGQNAGYTSSVSNSGRNAYGFGFDNTTEFPSSYAARANTRSIRCLVLSE